MALTGGSARAQDDAKKDKEYKVYSGSSKKGDIQEAVANAIEEARKAAPGADRQVHWTIKKVSGVNGGIDPLNIVTVEIEATVT